MPRKLLLNPLRDSTCQQSSLHNQLAAVIKQNKKLTMKRANKQARRARLLGVNHKQTNQAKFRCQVNLINYNRLRVIRMLMRNFSKLSKRLSLLNNGTTFRGGLPCSLSFLPNFFKFFSLQIKMPSNNCFNDRHVIFPSPYLQRA